MKRVVLFSVVSTLCYQGALASGYLFNWAYLAPVTNGPGKSGSQWVSEISVSNPQERALVITAELQIDGTTYSRQFTVAARSTVTWANYLWEFWNRTGTGGVLLEAESRYNGNADTDCLAFAVSNTILNIGTGRGTYGQEVPPIDVLTGFLGSWPAYFAGIKQFGSPGASGYRTNLIFWNTRSSAITMRVSIYGKNGQLLWQNSVLLPGATASVQPLPSGLEVRDGTLVVNPLGQYNHVAAAVSVVDNVTGDGLHRDPTLQSPDELIQCGVKILGTHDASDRPARETNPRAAHEAIATEIRAAAALDSRL